jgi:hypothetical protein
MARKASATSMSASSAIASARRACGPPGAISAKARSDLLSGSIAAGTARRTASATS